MTFCTTPFRMLADRRREMLGLPDLPTLFLPHPLMTRTASEIDKLAMGVLDQTLALLTGTSPVKEALQ